MMSGTIGKMISPVTTGLGYAAALVVVPAVVGGIALRRIAGFPRSMEPVMRLRAAFIPAIFGIVVRVRGVHRVRAAVEHAAGLGRPGGMVVVANHVNIFDAFVIRGYLQLPVRGLELESHFNWPVYGTVMRLYGNIPIPHGSPRTAKRRLERARQLLARGVPLVVMPEGHRTRTGGLRRFMGGPFRLAKSADVPVLPLVMAGAWQRQRVGTIRITPGVVELRVAPVVTRDDVRSRSVRELGDLVRHVMEDSLR